MELLFADSPALRRLHWVLDGVDGRWDGGADVTGALTPEFIARVPVGRLLEVMRDRAERFAPIRVVGLEADRLAATARFRTRHGELFVSHVQVEPEAPHRIAVTYTQAWIPDYLTPALPADFTGVPVPPAPGAVLVVFGGVPGTGKTTVAERVGAALGVPVFAGDWLMGALSPFGMRHHPDLAAISLELLTTLAYRQLSAAGSVVLDTTSEDPATRTRWASLAIAAGATYIPVLCTCTDQNLHRARLQDRIRDIPGWADGGDWADTSARAAGFTPWPQALVLDTAQPLSTCIQAVLDRIHAD